MERKVESESQGKGQRSDMSQKVVGCEESLVRCSLLKRLQWFLWKG